MNETNPTSTELRLGQPFAVQCTSSSEPGVFAIRAVFLGVMADALVLDWSRHLGPFFALARAGGLGGNRTPPSIDNTKFECAVQTDDSDQGTLIEWVVSGINVAAEASRVLVNLIESTQYKLFDHRLDLLEIEYDNVGSLPPKPEFPPMWPDCPFELEEFPIENENFDVEVVFEQDLPADDFRRVCELVSPWLKATMEGGFGGRPYDAIKPGLQVNEKLFSKAGKSVIVHIQEFYASPDALLSLQNVLIAIHHAGLRIDYVVIAE